MSLVVRDSTYSGIDLQFPALYREDGEFMIEFTKAYYKFLDETIDRNIPKLRDIDTTLSSFLVFFKKKYLADLPLDTVIDTRFIIKHVTDLYKRKGTQESLELLFQLFYNEQIEVFYPANNILMPSASVWGGDTYLEMNPVFVVDGYPIQKGDRIKGNISSASSFVDEIIFVNFTGSLVPLIYLSNTSGKFLSDDSLEVTRGGVRTNAGKLISGSISQITVEAEGRASGQVVGNRVKLVSDAYGNNATATILSVSDTTTGQIEFNIDDGGFGYADPSSVTVTNTIGISDQVLIITQTESPTIKAGDTISSVEFGSGSGSAITSLGGQSFDTQPTSITGSGTVIAYIHPLIYISKSTEFNLFPVSPVDVSGDIINDMVASFNINDTEAGTLTSVSAVNRSASYELSAINNNETVTLITDQIGDYETVILGATDYGMSGAESESLETTLAAAFTTLNVELGTIAELKITSSGGGYENDVYSNIENVAVSKFGKRDIIINFSDTSFLLKAGDIITQERTIENLTGAGLTIPYTVKAKLIRRAGNDYYFRQLSFYDFDEDVSVNITGNLYTISNIKPDPESLPMGANAVISGRASYETGQIESVAIVNSGYRYQDAEVVSLVSIEDGDYFNKIVAKATINAQGVGATEGTWKTTTSFLSENTKRIHDNYYYQEYSYEVSSIIDPAKYVPLINETVGVAGTKIFSTSLISSVNDVQPTVDVEIEEYDIGYENLYTEDGVDVVTTEDSADNIIVTIGTPVVSGT